MLTVDADGLAVANVAVGAGIPRQVLPPSRVRTTDVHGLWAHGAVPRTQPLSVLIQLVDCGANFAGTAPPAGPGGGVGDPDFDAEPVAPTGPVERDAVVDEVGAAELVVAIEGVLPADEWTPEDEQPVTRASTAAISMVSVIARVVVRVMIGSFAGIGV